jgi:hypothetical protein
MRRAAFWLALLGLGWWLASRPRVPRCDGRHCSPECGHEWGCV